MYQQKNYYAEINIKQMIYWKHLDIVKSLLYSVVAFKKIMLIWSDGQLNLVPGIWYLVPGTWHLAPGTIGWLDYSLFGA